MDKMDKIDNIMVKDYLSSNQRLSVWWVGYELKMIINGNNGYVWLGEVERGGMYAYKSETNDMKWYDLFLNERDLIIMIYVLKWCMGSIVWELIIVWYWV